ncbi:guanylate cyclase domain-containing protein, partial [Haematococcus lacustris]
CKISFYVAGIAASYIQNNGTQSGFWFDPDSDGSFMRPLVGNNEAMRTVLQLLVDLQAFMPSERTCSNGHPAFLAGKCLMTIDWGGVFRAALTSNISRPGMLGIAPLPGSTQILDRTTLKLVNCTPALCPMAQPYRTARVAPNVTRTLPGAWVNTAPFPAFGGWTASVAASSPPEVQLATLAFFAYITSLSLEPRLDCSPNNSWADVLNVSGSVDPFRQQHLDPANIGRWTAAGYDQGTTIQYLSALSMAMASPNVALDSRMAYEAKAGRSYRTFFESAYLAVSKNMTDYHMIDALLVLDRSLVQSQQETLQMLGNPDPLELRQQYWYLIGRVASFMFPVPPPLTSGVDSTREVVIGACLAGGLLLLFSLGLLAWQRVVRLRRNHRSALGKLLPPGAGPDTTLVLTDVQDSTTLYECLPVEVMDACMRIAERIIRDLLAAHQG